MLRLFVIVTLFVSLCLATNDNTVKASKRALGNVLGDCETLCNTIDGTTVTQRNSCRLLCPVVKYGGAAVVGYLSTKAIITSWRPSCDCAEGGGENEGKRSIKPNIFYSVKGNDLIKPQTKRYPVVM